MMNLHHLTGHYLYLSRALSLSPRDSHIKGALAEIEKRRNNFENADRLLREALESPDVEALRQRIHRVICHTQIADNLRRWAEELSRAKYDTNEIIPKLQEAYDFAKKAIDQSANDHQALDTYREVCIELGLILNRKEPASGNSYLELAIVKNPKSFKERKSTVMACLYLAYSHMTQNKEQAKLYLEFGKKFLRYFPSHANLNDKYSDLLSSLPEQEVIGKLTKVIPGKGYGFLSTDNITEQSFFLHISQIIPVPTLGDFELMVGQSFSFTIGTRDYKKQAVCAKRL